MRHCVVFCSYSVCVCVRVLAAYREQRECLRQEGMQQAGRACNQSYHASLSTLITEKKSLRDKQAKLCRYPPFSPPLCSVYT